jgi:hypothetical protein
MKELERRQEFKELQDTGRLQSYMRRRGKKLAAKDKKRGNVAGLM